MILYFGNMLSKHGFTATFIETFVPKLQEKYPIIAVSSQKNSFFRLLEMIWVLLQNARKAKLVLIDTFSTKAFYFAVVLSGLSKMFRIPFCPILHGGDLPKRLKNSPKLSRFVFRNSAENISPSLYLKHEFEKQGFSTTYIPNFIEIENYSFKKRTKFTPKILWVRSFHEIYNPQFAILILAKLLKKYPNSELCMVGPDKDGSMEDIKILAKELGIENHLKITGKLEKSKWLALSKNYDIFLNTTNFDNMPVSVIEAMALGLPVVSTNVGGLRYLHKNGVDGLLVEKNDIDGMVNKILSILDDNQLAESLSLNARRKAETFDWDTIKLQWENLITTL